MRDLDNDREAPRLPQVYVGLDDQPIVLANQFGIIQDAKSDEFILTVGQLQLPQLLGTDQEKAEQLAKLAFIGIRVVGRYSLTRPRVEALIAMLQANLAQEDAETP